MKFYWNPIDERLHPGICIEYFRWHNCSLRTQRRFDCNDTISGLAFEQNLPNLKLFARYTQTMPQYPRFFSSLPGTWGCSDDPLTCICNQFSLAYLLASHTIHQPTFLRLVLSNKIVQIHSSGRLAVLLLNQNERIIININCIRFIPHYIRRSKHSCWVSITERGDE